MHNNKGTRRQKHGSGDIRGRAIARTGRLLPVYSANDSEICRIIRFISDETGAEAAGRVLLTHDWIAEWSRGGGTLVIPVAEPRGAGKAILAGDVGAFLESGLARSWFALERTGPPLVTVVEQGEKIVGVFRRWIRPDGRLRRWSWKLILISWPCRIAEAKFWAGSWISCTRPACSAEPISKAFRFRARWLRLWKGGCAPGES
jgi:hypothetical protein